MDLLYDEENLKKDDLQKQNRDFLFRGAKRKSRGVMRASSEKNISRRPFL